MSDIKENLNKLMNVAVCDKEKSSNTDPSPTNENDSNTHCSGDNSNDNNVISSQARKEEEKCEQARKLQALGTRIDESILRAFKSYVFNKYGRLNKVFSLEIEAALEHHLICNRKQQQTTNLTFFESDKKYRSDVHLRLVEIANEFLRLKHYPNCSPETIKKIIVDVIGDRNERTFKKYVKIIRSRCKEKHAGFGVTHIFDVTQFCEETLDITIPRGDAKKKLDKVEEQ